MKFFILALILVVTGYAFAEDIPDHPAFGSHQVIRVTIVADAPDIVVRQLCRMERADRAPVVRACP